jgi:hypothetical protein
MLLESRDAQGGVKLRIQGLVGLRVCSRWVYWICIIMVGTKYVVMYVCWACIRKSLVC